LYRRCQKTCLGFTVIELVLVIVILGLLAAVAVSRLGRISTAAHEGVVAGTGGALATGIQMAHLQWIISGSPTTEPGIDDIAGFGDGTVDVNAAGWPTDAGAPPSDNAIPAGNAGAGQCYEVWRAVLVSSPGLAWLGPDSPSGPTLRALATDALARSLSALVPSAMAKGPPPPPPLGDFIASAPAANLCVYVYGRASNLSITYDATTGRVVIDSDASS
jgi:prepilin-type N-terminal cleavage/methylation domain-containing protein